MGRKIWRVISTILVIAVFVMLAYVFVQRITGREPEILGYRMNYIRTGSMEPTIKSGDVILCRRVDAAEVKLDDVITYANDGRITSLPEGETVCHRVVAEPYTEEGVLYIPTKGDANSEADPVITGEQVIGRYLKTLTIMTLFYKVFLTKWGFLIVIIPLALLLVVELYRLTHAKEYAEAQPSDEGNNNNTDKTGEADETV